MRVSRQISQPSDWEWVHGSFANITLNKQWACVLDQYNFSTGTAQKLQQLSLSLLWSRSTSNLRFFLPNQHHTVIPGYITRLHLQPGTGYSLKFPTSGTGSLSLHFSHKRLCRLQEAAPFSSELVTNGHTYPGWTSADSAGALIQWLTSSHFSREQLDSPL